MKTNDSIAMRILKSMVMPIIIFFIFFTATRLQGITTFGSIASFGSLMKQCIVLYIIALALSINMQSNRWDFSMGASLMLTCIISGNICIQHGLSVGVFLVFCVILSMLLSVVVGIVYVLIKIPPLIVSLGILMIYESLTGVLFNSGGIVLYSFTNLTVFGRAPYIYILLVVALVVYEFVTQYTRFGHDMKSLAGGQAIAVHIGVKEKKNIILAFLLSGFFIGLAAVIYVSINGQVKPALSLSSTSILFAAITPTIMGMYFAKFSNMPVGIFIGTFSLQLFTNGLIALGMNQSIQSIVAGVFLVVFVIFTFDPDRLKVLLRQWKLRKCIN